MEDIKRVWHLLVAGLHAVFAFIDYFARSSPVMLGFVLIVLAVLVRVYQKRRHFYGSLHVAGDWDPTYGGVVSAGLAETGICIVYRLTMFFGLMVLFQHFLPVLFDDVVGFLVRVTG